MPLLPTYDLNTNTNRTTTYAPTPYNSTYSPYQSSSERRIYQDSTYATYDTSYGVPTTAEGFDRHADTSYGVRTEEEFDRRAEDSYGVRTEEEFDQRAEDSYRVDVGTERAGQDGGEGSYEYVVAESSSVVVGGGGGGGYYVPQQAPPQSSDQYVQHSPPSTSSRNYPQFSSSGDGLGDYSTNRGAPPGSGGLVEDYSTNDYSTHANGNAGGNYVAGMLYGRVKSEELVDDWRGLY